MTNENNFHSNAFAGSPAVGSGLTKLEYVATQIMAACILKYSGATIHRNSEYSVMLAKELLIECNKPETK